MKLLAVVAGLACAADAHTLFTTLFINGKNQGEGTCVRMPHDGATANGPIYPVTGDDMACGRDGAKAVAFTCPAPQAATLTFEFREWTDGSKPGAIDGGHKGPCAVYVKKVDDMERDKPAGSGWFKIWEDGYDTATGKWCVDRLIANKGLLSVDLPPGLPAGYYLVRPEVLALHNAPEGDPQYYLGCAQVFVQEGPKQALVVPREYQAQIPGYVDAATAGLTYNIYNERLPPYPIPGPKVFVPKAGPDDGKTAKAEQKQGLVPKDCLVKNANWCGLRLAPYSNEEGCWAGVKECYRQGQVCWDGAPPSGDANCEVWQGYCKQLESDCEAGRFRGPSEFTGREKMVKTPGAIPRPWNNVFEGQEAPASSAGSAAPETTERATRTLTATLSRMAETQPAATPTEQAQDEEQYAKGSDRLVDVAERLQVSRDGRCGGKTGQTCRGSEFGECCSSKGWCGRSKKHCECDCQGAFGQCRRK
ncbi:hypothetical protein HIM_01365 [Hirsutella minnesotensis 3608]|nr:hypothetical protein HIM_01365 [Hirsutella minnesotensis 3608]